MKKVQLNFTETAARCVTAGTVFRRTTTELYDLYNHPEDMILHIHIMGDGSDDKPDMYIIGITLQTLRYALSQLNNTALNNSVIWLRAYNGEARQEFATVCDTQYKDFEVNGCSFKLCDFTMWSSEEPAPGEDIIICHEDEASEMLNNIKNAIK